MLSVRGVAKSYGPIVALTGVDLEIARGQILGLLGPNGAGKTTLVSIIAGLRRADRGTVLVGGVDVSRDPREVRRQLGLAPQDLGMYPRLRVRDNLRLFGELAGLRRRVLDERIDDIAGRLSLSPLLDRKAGGLSGGERRRLHTAIALLHKPPLLLLDEPTAGADVQSRSELLELVGKLAAEGSAVCYCTHYLNEIEALEADVAILSDGRIVACGPRAQLVQANGGTEVVLTFDGSPPSLGLGPDAVVNGATVRIPTDRPEAVVAAATAALGPDAHRLRSLEVVEPSLESVYLELTRGTGDEELAAPLPSPNAGQR